MPPNAEFRQRRFANDDIDTLNQNANDDAATEARVSTTKGLASTEIAIEGVIYDLTDFKHPGGEVVHLFGGNDVTVQYKMIHPRHNAKHLEKMKAVGKVTDYQPEYLFDTEFEREIKREVYKIVRPGKEFGTPGWFFRAITYCGIMAGLQYLWATTGSTWTLAILLGISQASIGLNVQHDANHGAASRRPWINDIFGFGADMIGGAKWLWMEQHWTHHAYTNHAAKDPDSFSAEPIMNFNDYPPNHSKRRFWHKFQGLYFLPLLSFYWLSSVFNPQVLDLQQRGAQSIGMNMENAFIVKRRKYAVTLRLLYIYLNIVAPILIKGFNLVTIAQIMTMGFAESLTLASLFALSHNFENSDRDPTDSFRKTGKPVCWFKSQVETSSTYGGWLSGALTGGLNFQVEHHLFPRMSSAYYPYIAPKVREICKKHGVRYAYYPWIWQNFISTFKYMHSVGVGANWTDELQPLSGKN